MNIVIVGFGNIGQFALDAVERANDMNLVGIVVRNLDKVSDIYKSKYNFVTDVKDIKEKVDVAILALPSKSIRTEAVKYLTLGISTVDSFDIHSEIVSLRKDFDKVCKENNVSAIISAGWDPGTDSIVRAMLEACAPTGLTYTNFGPGMSMGHSVVAKSFDGVKDALSMTMPVGAGVHRRIVYVELEPNVDFESIKKQIKADDYFAHDETIIIQTDDVKKLIDMGHGVSLTRKGGSGTTHNQLFEFKMTINNPALTSQIMVSCARATAKRTAGAYTMIELPMIDLLEGDNDEIIKRLV